MPEKVLPVLLADVNDVVAVLGDTRPPGEVLGVGEEVAPLGRKQVHDVEVFPLGLGMASLGGQEVDVGVAAVPTIPVHVNPAFEAQSQLPLPRFDLHPGAQGLVLESPRHVHDDLAAGQPPLAAAVDVGVGDLSEAEIAADVDMPGAEIGIDLVVVSVGLVGNAFGGAEVDAAGDRFAAVVVEDGDVNPVAPAVEKLHPHARGFHRLLLFHVAPPDLTHLIFALLHRHRRRRNGGDLHVGRARPGIPAPPPSRRNHRRRTRRPRLRAMDERNWPCPGPLPR